MSLQLHYCTVLNGLTAPVECHYCMTVINRLTLPTGYHTYCIAIHRLTAPVRLSYSWLFIFSTSIYCVCAVDIFVILLSHVIFLLSILPGVELGMPRAKRHQEEDKPRGRISSYAFFTKTFKEEYAEQHPGKKMPGFGEMGKKCAERWKVIHWNIVKGLSKSRLGMCS